MYINEINRSLNDHQEAAALKYLGNTRPSPIQQKILTAVSVLSFIAMLIITSLGAAGVLTGSQVGYGMLSLGLAPFAVTLSMGKLKERKFLILTFAISALLPVILGSLAMGGVLSAYQASWGLLGTMIGSVGLVCCCSCINLTLALRP